MIQGREKVALIVVAAGRGVRFGGKQKKQYRPLANQPLLAHTLKAFEPCDRISEVFLVVSPEDREFCQKEVLTAFPFEKPIHLVSGGTRRQDSVFRGLAATQGRFDVIAIHDGVRPFVSMETVVSCIETAKRRDACIPTHQIADTVKELEKDGRIRSTLNRNRLRLAQTPQVFRYDVIWKAHVAAADEKYQGTDDAQLVERLGFSVMTVPGSPGNIKITTAEDFRFAAVLIERSPRESST